MVEHQKHQVFQVQRLMGYAPRMSFINQSVVREQKLSVPVQKNRDFFQRRKPEKFSVFLQPGATHPRGSRLVQSVVDLGCKCIAEAYQSTMRLFLRWNA